MLLTVEDVVQLDVMAGARVHTAESQLNIRPVESITVIEVPVENFVQKNEFVLSTAVGCGHDSAQFRGFVREVSDLGAAALGVATGPHLSEIPQDALRLAEERNLPLIEIPWETRFADIIQKVLRELDNRQDRLSEWSKEVQQQLLQHILEGSGLSDIAEAVHRQLGHPVLFVDPRGDIKGKSPGSHPFALDWSNRSQASPVFVSNPLQEQPGFSHPQWRWFQLDHHPCLEIPIRSARKVQGYLLCFLPSDAEIEGSLNQEMIVILEHAATAAALWFLQENVVLETETRLRNDFVWSLAKGEWQSKEAIQSRAKALGYDVTLTYTCVVGKVEKAEGTFGEQVLQHTMRSLEEVVQHAGRTLQRRTLTTYQDRELVTFVEVPPERVVDTVHTLLDLVESRIQERMPGCVISWGIGEKQAGVCTFRAGYQDARTALNIGRRQKGPGHRNFYVDTGLYRALHHLAEDPDMRDIAWSAMGRLIDYSRQRGIDLIGTFNAYIRNQCNVSQTSREMNLHRQSLLYRLRKIESLTGRSLLDPDDLFLLQLSIKIWTSGEAREEERKDGSQPSR